jgi:hypothetical protein
VGEATSVAMSKASVRMGPNWLNRLFRRTSFAIVAIKPGFDDDLVTAHLSQNDSALNATVSRATTLFKFQADPSLVEVLFLDCPARFPASLP